MNTFSSRSSLSGRVELPDFSGILVMMMPVVLGDMASVPDNVAPYRDMLSDLFDIGGHHGEIGYLTIDEREVRRGETHRRAGLHVDGVYNGSAGGWGGGAPGGGWGSVGNGMLTVSSHAMCRVFNKDFVGWPGMEGECDHLVDQCDAEAQIILGPGEVHWLDGLCVHESMPAPETVKRQFVRLSMPSEAPWFEGYTKNALGVMPTGPILPARTKFYLKTDLRQMA